MIRYEHFRPRSERWVLYTHNGSRVLGKHANKKQAIAQEEAIYANEDRRKKKRRRVRGH